VERAEVSNNKDVQFKYLEAFNNKLSLGRASLCIKRSYNSWFLHFLFFHQDVELK